MDEVTLNADVRQLKTQEEQGIPADQIEEFQPGYDWPNSTAASIHPNEEHRPDPRNKVWLEEQFHMLNRGSGPKDGAPKLNALFCLFPRV